MKGGKIYKKDERCMSKTLEFHWDTGRVAWAFKLILISYSTWRMAINERQSKFLDGFVNDAHGTFSLGWGKQKQ
jgi:hypothetical protein